MSYNKKQFMHLLSEYKSLVKKNNETLKTFTESKDYSEEAKSKAKAAAKNQLAQYKEQYEKLLNGLLDTAISGVTEKITQRASDKDYQQSLSNAFRMMELAGKDMDPRELQALVKPFAGDEMAVKAFRGVLSKHYTETNDQYKLATLLPSGSDAKTIKMLDQIKSNVQKALDPEGQPNPFGGDTFQVREMYLDSIEDFIGNKTNDNFECIEE